MEDKLQLLSQDALLIDFFLQDKILLIKIMHIKLTALDFFRRSFSKQHRYAKNKKTT